MAKINTNALNDLAASLDEFPADVKEEMQDEVLDYVSEKIGAKYEKVVNASSKVSSELIELASSAEEIENSIASSANGLESVDGIPEISSSPVRRSEEEDVWREENDELNKLYARRKAAEEKEKIKEEAIRRRENDSKFQEEENNKLVKQYLKNIEEKVDDIDEEEPSFWHKLIYGTPESNKTLLENAEIIANDNDAIKEEYYNEHGYVTGGDLAVGAISIVEGVGIFAEDIVKVADIALSGAVTAFGALMALVSLPTNKNSWNEFKIFTEDIWDRTASRISKDHVSSVFDSFYNNTEGGQSLKSNTAHFDTARSFGVGVGYVGGAVLTGGAISSAAGIAGATASLASSGINGAVYGLARFGGSTGDAVQNGASMEEALLYGGLTGAKEGIGMFVGSVINSVNPVKGALPMTKGAWVNSATHVALDTLDGAVSATADPLIQTVVQSIYTPSEEKLSEMDYKGTAESYKNLSFGEKYKVNFEANGGVNNVVGTALFSGVMSAGSEVIGQLKANSSVKKGQKLYNEVVENNTEINNIKGQSMLNDNNSLAYNTLDDLYAQRDSLKQAYDKLDDYGKYAFELSLTKDAINSGKIASADIDILLNSGKLKSLYQNLSNQERLALFDAMDETQMRSYFGQLGEKESKSFINKNSSYISDRFFNTDSASSTWSNSTSLIESKTDLMVVKNTSNSVDSNNVDIIARNKFESRVGDIEADYNEAIDGIIDEYYTSLRPDVAVPKEKRAISVIQKKYGNNSDYEKAINLYYDELDDSAKKLSDSFLETYTTNYDSPTALTSSLLAKTSASKQQLAKKIEEIDSLIEEFKTKASYDIFGPHRTNVKVYSGLKEDFMDQYKKVESLENSIKTTDKKYVDSVVEKGKELLGESDFEKLDRIFHPQKVEPVTEILEDSTITRGKKLTTEVAKGRVGVKNSTGATSKIGFQFFATPKNSDNLHNISKNIEVTGKQMIPSEFFSFSLDFSESIAQMSEYFGDAGSHVNKLFKKGKSVERIIEKLNGDAKEEFLYYLKNTREGRYLASLTYNEIQSLMIYANGPFDKINGMLRRENVEGVIHRYNANDLIRNIDNAIVKYDGLDETMEIYRGVKVGAFKSQNSIYASIFENVDINNLYDVYASLKVLEGKIFGDLGYMSASPGYCTSFAKRADMPIVLDIIAEKGTPSAYINQISEFYNSENELLLARGTKLYMVEVMPPQKDISGLDKIIVKCVVVK